MRARCLFAVVFLILPMFVAASEEEFLPWSEVRITCGERAETGNVVFAAKMKGDKFEEITIGAFGKEHKIDGPMRAKLTGFPLSSVATTHEAGFERLGGHMVHFKFKKIELDKDRNPVEVQITLSISKEKGAKLSEPREKALKAAAALPKDHFVKIQARGLLKVTTDAKGEVASAELVVSPGDESVRFFMRAGTWRLNLGADQMLRDRARRLNGQTVLVSGELQTDLLIDLVATDFVPEGLHRGMRGSSRPDHFIHVQTLESTQRSP